MRYCNIRTISRSEVQVAPAKDEIRKCNLQELQIPVHKPRVFFRSCQCENNKLVKWSRKPRHRMKWVRLIVWKTRYFYLTLFCFSLTFWKQKLLSQCSRTYKHRVPYNTYIKGYSLQQMIITAPEYMYQRIHQSYTDYQYTHTFRILGVGTTCDSLRLSACSASDCPMGSAAPLQM